MKTWSHSFLRANVYAILNTREDLQGVAETY